MSRASRVHALSRNGTVSDMRSIHHLLLAITGTLLSLCLLVPALPTSRSPSATKIIFHQADDVLRSPTFRSRKEINPTLRGEFQNNDHSDEIVVSGRDATALQTRALSPTKHRGLLGSFAFTDIREKTWATKVFIVRQGFRYHLSIESDTVIERITLYYPTAAGLDADIGAVMQFGESTGGMEFIVREDGFAQLVLLFADDGASAGGSLYEVPADFD